MLWSALQTVGHGARLGASDPADIIMIYTEPTGRQWLVNEQSRFGVGARGEGDALPEATHVLLEGVSGTAKRWSDNVYNVGRLTRQHTRGIPHGAASRQLRPAATLQEGLWVFGRRDERSSEFATVIGFDSKKILRITRA
jgi:hypothetical protein